MKMRFQRGRKEVITIMFSLYPAQETLGAHCPSPPSASQPTEQTQGPFGPPRSQVQGPAPQALLRTSCPPQRQASATPPTQRTMLAKGKTQPDGCRIEALVSLQLEALPPFPAAMLTAVAVEVTLPGSLPRRREGRMSPRRGLQRHFLDVRKQKR